jgi:glycosyltransferase involved in cell wall biosynthesis
MVNKFNSLDRLKNIKENFRNGEGGSRIKKGNNKSPTFTIITVVLNNEKYLEETIKSVLHQKYKDFEYILIDGGSVDNSLNIIKKYSDYIDYWVSEKDLGIYDAFNKGMTLAKGKFIGIVNSDDKYFEDSLEIISRYIFKFPSIDFIFGSVKKHWGVLHGYKPKKIYYSWGFYTSHSTGFFIKTSSAKKIGFYNLKYKYHADYDYFYRMIVKEKMLGMATSKDEIIGEFRRGGFSSTISFWKLFKEEILIRYDNGQNLILILIIFIYKFIFHSKKIFISNKKY